MQCDMVSIMHGILYAYCKIKKTYPKKSRYFPLPENYMILSNIFKFSVGLPMILLNLLTVQLIKA